MMRRRTDSVLIYSEYGKNRERNGREPAIGTAFPVTDEELAMLREVLTKIIKEHEDEDTAAR